MRASIRSIAFAAAVAAGLSAAPAAAQSLSWFNQADRNDDGRVTFPEYERSQPSFAELGLNFNGRYSWISRPWNRALAARLDQNRDGRISHAEYDATMRRNFRRYDRNGDGMATRIEVFGKDRRRDDSRS